MSIKGSRRIREPRARIALVVFASTMMLWVGIFQGIGGLPALFNDELFVVGKQGFVPELDYTAWGLIHGPFDVG